MRILSFLIIAALIGCTTKVEPPSRVSLSWEKDHVERIAWSDTLTKEVTINLEDLSKASDVATFCPKFKTLTQDKQVKALSELFVAMSYYESSWKPDTDYRECDISKCRYGECFKHAVYGYCMKGNPSYDGGVVTSRGLLQMSISSSNSYGCGLKDSKELHLPDKNLSCAVLIMKKQIAREGVIAASRSYWAVVKSSYSGNKIDKIRDRILVSTIECK